MYDDARLNVVLKLLFVDPFLQNTGIVVSPSTSKREINRTHPLNQFSAIQNFCPALNVIQLTESNYNSL